MKILNLDPRKPSRAIAPLLVLGLATAPLAADGGDMSSTGGAGTLQLASEVIGTLPSWWVDDDAAITEMPELETTAYQRDLHLQTYVPEELLEEFVLAADGDGYVFLSLDPELAGMVRVRFYGDVRVELDRQQVIDNGLGLSLELGLDNQDGFGAIGVDGSLSSPFAFAALGDGIDVPFGSSPTFDAQFETSQVELLSVAADAESTSGWDVGRVAVASDEGAYTFEFTVIDSLLP